MKTEPCDDFVDVLMQEATAAARCFGVTACDELAAALVDRVLLRSGGLNLYLPRRSARERQRARQEIVRRFDGDNVDDLAREYAVTPRYVRKILSEHVEATRASTREVDVAAESISSGVVARALG